MGCCWNFKSRREKKPFNSCSWIFIKGINKNQS